MMKANHYMRIGLPVDKFTGLLQLWDSCLLVCQVHYKIFRGVCGLLMMTRRALF